MKYTNSEPGWYFYSKKNSLAEWDGEAWTGTVKQSESPSTVPKFRHGFLPFLIHGWFWVLIIGQVIVIAIALLSKSNGAWLNSFSIFGYTLCMLSGVMLLSRHLRFNTLPNLKKITVSWTH